MSDHQTTQNARTAVLIVGAGPSGLALAIELGTRGIECVVIERNDRVGYAPRAKTTNVRTRTHLRRWGIAKKLAEQSPFGIDYPSDVKFVTRLNGALLTTIENASNCAPAQNAHYPEHGQWIPQYRLEEVLRQHAESLASVSFRFSTDFVTAVDIGDSVRAEFLDRPTGKGWFADCAFLIGADGARSAVRDLIGAKMEGRYGLSRNYNVVFRAPGLATAHPHGPATMYWQVNPTSPSLIGPMDRDDVWFFMPTRLPEGFTITPDTASDLIRASAGIEGPIEVLSSDEWVASSLIADRYREGRLFLIGDACHLHPPFGGYGMNMGIADGVDLGWKLSAVLGGWGGPQLLDSYQIERRAVHAEVIAEAEANHAVLSNDFWREGLEESGPKGDQMRQEIGAKIYAAKEREFHTLGTVLGGCYSDSPVIRFEADRHECQHQEGSDSRIYRPTSAPGCLAPHVWLADDESLYDRLGLGFALICRTSALPSELNRARDAAARSGEPLAVVTLTDEQADNLYPAALTLVRPDQFVAWRGEVLDEGVLAMTAGWEISQDLEAVERASATC